MSTLYWNSIDSADKIPNNKESNTISDVAAFGVCNFLVLSQDTTKRKV